MSSIPLSAGVEKAFFPSASPATISTTPAGRSTSAASVPQPPLLPPPSAPAVTAVRTVPAASGAAASLSAECTEKASSVIDDDLRHLSRDDLDVKRWLNSTLSRVLEAAKDASGEVDNSTINTSKATAIAAARKSHQVDEQLVQLLYARVQTHSQELSASIDDLISNTLVRLPRTTMELSRMSAETEELTQQLQSIEAIVQPAANTKMDAYVTQLHSRKASEVKLRTCTRLLEKAARLEESIRNIQYLVEHRELKNANSNTEKASPAPNADPTKSDDGSDSEAGNANMTTAATHQRDLDEVAAIIRQARDDLKEITAVDDTFGEQYRVQLGQFEQYIERALEEECVACLRAHQLERATRLITTLYSIGRANAVLKRYGEQAAAQLVEQQEASLHSTAASANQKAKEETNNEKSAGGAGRTTSPAAAVAELLRCEIIPDDSAFLSQELIFLSSLVRGVGAVADEKASANASSGAVAPVDVGSSETEPSKAGQRTSFSATAVDDASSTSQRITSVLNTATPSTKGGAVEDNPSAMQILEVFAVLLTKLHAAVEAVLRPLLTERSDTTTKDYVACFTAIQQLKITASSANTTAVAADGADSTRVLMVIAKDPLEKLAREVTHRALVLFASLFQEERVLERYSDRVCGPVAAYCSQPLGKILAPSTTPSSTSNDDTLEQVLTQAAQEVLVYVPEKISARCTAAWHALLSKALVQQLKPTESTSQHVLLQHLYLYKQRIKPLMLKTKQAVEDWLSSGAMYERYPTSAGLLRADLQTRLWIPLKAEVEEAQKATELGILSSITEPILAKVENYQRLPCWGNQVDAKPGSPTPQLNAAALALNSLGTYTQGQVAPSGAVREMGEMLMELPLTLETLASTAVAESYRERGCGSDRSNTNAVNGSLNAVDIPANDTEAEEGVRLLIDEQAEEWLETVVRDVVRAFLDEKVLPLQVGPFTALQQQQQQQQQGEGGQVGSPQAEVTAQLYVIAMEQLTTDLDYLRNILSAVNEESEGTVERVMSAIQALPAARQGSFVMGEAIGMTSSLAGEVETTLKEAAEPDSS